MTFSLRKLLLFVTLLAMVGGFFGSGGQCEFSVLDVYTVYSSDIPIRRVRPHKLIRIGMGYCRHEIFYLCSTRSHSTPFSYYVTLYVLDKKLIDTEGR